MFLDYDVDYVRGQGYSISASRSGCALLHPDATPRSEDKGAYRVVSVRVNDSGFRSTYAVEVQAAEGFEFADETFTVRVDAPEGFDQAVRRAVRKSGSP